MGTETEIATESGTATAAAAAAATATAGMEMEGGTGMTGRVRGMGETETIASPSQNRQSVERAGGTTKKSTTGETFAANGSVPIAGRVRGWQNRTVKLDRVSCQDGSDLLSELCVRRIREDRCTYPVRTVFTASQFGQAKQLKPYERIDTLVFANLSLYLYVCPVCALTFTYSAEITFRRISVPSGTL